MAHYFDILVLAVVQGIAEFLPISSDGHLVVTATLLEELYGHKLPDLLSVTIALHAGTLLSILVVFRQRIWRLLREDRRAILLILLGTVPAVLVGLPIHEIQPLREAMESPLLAGLGLIGTAMMLLWAERRAPGDMYYTELSPSQALWIGVLQASAILPGVSRSGTTIAGGLRVGLRRDAAATFSFLLAIPAISGAVGLDIIKIARASPSRDDVIPLLVGAAVSFVVGLLALAWLLRWLERGRLRYFAYWCLAVGIPVVIWRLIRLAG